MPENSVAILIVEDDDDAYPSFGTLPASHAQYGFRLLRGIFLVILVIWTVVWLKLLRDALL
ncbi:protein UL2 [Human betaherpesvirus 5]|uniref:Protein UL2 n=1 Tax=Human cytomegalovirus TaxID=10359 RepID=A0A0G2TSC5_HCMV|nr:protein UL2 [Human betaherpesvirus 5]AKI15089.1 protein UL2 [Human betaherpesvirus 5]AKI16089.1 protein UL2 [Human betaherpesvirus 5]AKI23811.1 protein UL2 [Human betaherpesvirus 5]AKI25332.1 protein UL2 [Human betaherpesvirus 5]